MASHAPKYPSRRANPKIQVRRTSHTMQAYCLKCRAHTNIDNAEQVTLKNGRPATRGKCSTCSATVFRIGRAT